jgi:rhamnosyltransferase
MINDIALGFILYNPTTNSIDRILEAARSDYFVFLVLNSHLDKSILDQLKFYPNIYITGNESNAGLSGGLNSICEEAYLKKFKALLNFDQDSVFTHETLDFALKFFKTITTGNNEDMRSIVCTTFRDNSILNKKYNSISSFKLADFNVENVYFTINSGSMYFLEKFREFKWFDKKYFVDGVDYSFCISSIKNKFKITEIYNTPGLDHESEQGNQPVKLLNRQMTGRKYSFRRNTDFVRAHLMLLASSMQIRSLKPKIFLIRSMMLYTFHQFIFRIKPNPR